jgi:DNA-binding response OmpR family regulator
MTKCKIKIVHDRRETFVNGKEVHLANAEYKILYALMETNRVMTRPELGELLGYEKERFELSNRVIDQHVARIRRKLHCCRSAVKTVPSVGYKYVKL